MEMQTEKKDLWSQGGEGESGVNGESSINTYALTCVRWMAGEQCCMRQGASLVLLC